MSGRERRRQIDLIMQHFHDKLSKHNFSKLFLPMCLQKTIVEASFPVAITVTVLRKRHSVRLLNVRFQYSCLLDSL